MNASLYAAVIFASLVISCTPKETDDKNAQQKQPLAISLSDSLAKWQLPVVKEALTRYPLGIQSTIDVPAVNAPPVPLRDSTIARINGASLTDWKSSSGLPFKMEIRLGLHYNASGNITRTVYSEENCIIDGVPRQLTQSDLGKIALIYVHRELDVIEESQNEIKSFHDITPIIDSVRILGYSVLDKWDVTDSLRKLRRAPRPVDIRAVLDSLPFKQESWNEDNAEKFHILARLDSITVNNEPQNGCLYIAYVHKRNSDTTTTWDKFCTALLKVTIEQIKGKNVLLSMASSIQTLNDTYHYRSNRIIGATQLSDGPIYDSFVAPPSQAEIDFFERIPSGI